MCKLDLEHLYRISIHAPRGGSDNGFDINKF